MEFFRKVIDNRYIYAQYLAIPATILSCLGFYNIWKSTSTIWVVIFLLGIALSICAYCLGGLLTVIKSAISIAKWGWVVVPFPYDLITFPIALLFFLIAFFLVPIIPIRKAYKNNR